MRATTQAFFSHISGLIAQIKREPILAAASESRRQNEQKTFYRPPPSAAGDKINKIYS